MRTPQFISKNPCNRFRSFNLIIWHVRTLIYCSCGISPQKKKSFELEQEKSDNLIENKSRHYPSSNCILWLLESSSLWELKCNWLFSCWLSKSYEVTAHHETDKNLRMKRSLWKFCRSQSIESLWCNWTSPRTSEWLLVLGCLQNLMRYLS